MSTLDDERGTGDRGTSTAPFQNTTGAPATLATMVPSAAPTLLYAGCRIPSNTILMKTDEATVTTRQDKDTQLRVRTDGKTLELSFEPDLLVKTQWGASNVDFGGLTYTFSSGSITAVRTGSSWDLFDASSQVGKKVEDWFRGIISGSRMSDYGYDLFADTDLLGTLRTLDFGSGGAVAATLDTCLLGADFSLTRDIAGGKGEVGVRIAARSKVTARVDFDRTVQQLLDGDIRATAATGFRDADAVLTYQGASLARLAALTIHYGGRVDVSYTALGVVQVVDQAPQALDLLMRGVLVTVAVASGELGRASDALSGSATITGALAVKINQAFTEAVDGLIEEYRDAIPGLDLGAAFGLPAEGMTITGSPNRIVFDPIVFTAGSDAPTP